MRSSLSPRSCGPCGSRDGQDAAGLGRRIADLALLARQFEQVGAAGVIVHGRTRQQGFAGSVNREGIRAVVEAVSRIPIVANGDVRTIGDAAAMFAETRCAAISIGRRLANPFFFSPARPLGTNRRPRPRPELR